MSAACCTQEKVSKNGRLSAVFRTSVEGNSMSERLVQKASKIWYRKSVHRMVRAIQSENRTARTAMIILRR